MQAVAQGVARENTILRTLLVSHGVAAPQIETCVQAASEGIGGPILTPRADSTKITTLPSSQNQKDHVKLSPITHQYGSQNPASVDPNTMDLSAPLANPNPTVPSHLLRASPSLSLSEVNSQQPAPEPKAELSGQTEPAKQTSMIDEDDATSCETAAWIIANLRGHDNADEVRAELGCTSNVECNVKNVTVFDAMDR